MAREMKESGVAWIGKIPQVWDTVRVKYVFKIIGGNGFPETLQGNTDGDYPFCKVSDINGSCIFVDTASNYISSETLMKYKFSLIPPKSILIAKIGAALLKNHRKINAVPCCIDNNTQALVPIRNDSIKYLYYLSKCIDMGWFNSASTIPCIDNSKLLNSLVPNVQFAEQERIAAFLDSKCVEIDAVLEKTRASIEEYKRLKQAIITEAVTKGVRGDRPMKDSEIEWLPSIPVEWGSYRGKHLFCETNERSETGTEELLTVSHITGITPRSQKNVNMFMSESLVGYKVCRVGDIAANTMWMWQGAIGVSDYHGVISPSYNTYRQRSGAFDSQYLDYLLRIRPLVDMYSVYSTGITASRLRLYPEQFLSFKFPVPPMEEQQEIVRYLGDKVGEMNTLIQKKEQFLTELETYKKSLIYEYVTGKKEVSQA